MEKKHISEFDCPSRKLFFDCFYIIKKNCNMAAWIRNPKSMRMKPISSVISFQNDWSFYIFFQCFFCLFPRHKQWVPRPESGLWCSDNRILRSDVRPQLLVVAALPEAPEGRQADPGWCGESFAGQDPGQSSQQCHNTAAAERVVHSLLNNILYLKYLK